MSTVDNQFDDGEPTVRLAPVASRLHGAAQYLFTLAIVVGAYFLYLRLVAPMVELPETDKRLAVYPRVDMLAPPVDKTRLIPLLPKDAWELEDCQSVLTPQGILLFQEFTEQENGTVRVFPFTLVSGLGKRDLIASSIPDPKADLDPRTPIVLRCQAGANLKFNLPVAKAIEQGDAKLELATLTGDVDVYRPPTRQDQADVLHLLTRNVQVDRNRIYALEQVRFSYGPHRGSGRNLLIDLAHDEGTAMAQRDFDTISGVSRLELAFLDRLRIAPTSDGNRLAIEANGADQAVKGTSSLFRKDSPLEVSCSGPFVFDFQASTVTLQDDVFARQLDEYQNNIRCDRLTMAFEQPDEVHSRQQVDDAQNGLPAQGLKLKRFVATGSPATVVSNSQPAKFSADQLVYDAPTGRVEGRCPNHSPRSVTILSTDLQVVAKHVQYTLTDDGSIGEFFSESPGRLLRLGEREGRELFVSWGRQLASQRDPVEPHRLNIVIDGNTTARIADQTKIESGSMTLHLWQSKSDTGKWEFTPAQLIARDQVSLTSPKLEGTTELLIASWEVADSRQTKRTHRVGRVPYRLQDQILGTGTAWGGRRRALGPPNRAGRSGAQLTGTRPAFQNQFAEVIPPSVKEGDAAVVTTGWAGPIQESPAKPRKLIFSGREIATLHDHPNRRSKILDVVVDGDVSVVQQELEPDGTFRETLAMSGDHLRVVPQRPNSLVASDKNDRPDVFQAVISSEIELARVATGDFILTGRKINLDQNANKLGVRGPGRIVVTPQKESPIATRENRLNALPTNAGETTDLDVTWEGGMIFDGKKLYFEHRVAVDSGRIAKDRQTQTRARAAALSVELNRAVDFRQVDSKGFVNSDPNAIQAREMVLVDSLSEQKRVFPVPVKEGPAVKSGLEVFHETFDKSGNRLEQQKVVARRAIVNVVDESIDGEGPGFVVVHRQESEQQDRAPRSGSSAKQVNPLSRFSQQGNKGISLLRINFDDSLKVNARDKQLRIFGRVRAAYQSVTNWKASIDPDQLTGREADAVQLTCQQLLLSQWKPRNASEETSELIASGNVRINSNQLEASANRLSYDQASDRLVLEGTPRSDAELRFRDRQRGSNTVVIGKKFRYQVSEQTFDGPDVKSFRHEQR